ARGKLASANIEDAQALKASLESKPLIVSERAGQHGRLFGAVSSKEVSEAVKAVFDKEINPRTVEIVTPIRPPGEHKATVRLHEDIFANLVVQVIAAKGAAKA